MKRFRISVCCIIFIFPFIYLLAQDAAKVDPQHYNVEFENDKLRVLRINYQPGEESVMHSHPEGVVVFLSDSKGKMKMDNGEEFIMDEKAGRVMWTDYSRHQPSNVSDVPFEVIQVELKESPFRAGKKSLHLFELPEGISEKELNDFLKEMNKAISKEGYPGAGYHLYKISDGNSENYRYFMEGIWPDSATYDKIHNSENWKKAAAKGKEMIEKIRANELYLRAERVK